MGDPKDEIYKQVILAMTPLDVDYVEGEGSTAQRTPEMLCPQCKKRGQVNYTGTDLIEGSLEYYHLVHTEVDHHLHCTGCGKTWAVFKML